MTQQTEVSTPAYALRVFIGFRHADLAPDRFRQDLGQTFIPGTPYMLQPLGVGAYLPAVFTEVAGSALPQEVALIAWRSQPAQRRATRETLRGRVYTQSHGGVYSPATGATFPIIAEKFDPGVPGSLYTFDVRTDWQEGSYGVFAGVKRDEATDARAFRSGVRDAIIAARPLLQDAGVDQCVVALGEAFVVVWTHFPCLEAKCLFAWSALDPLVVPMENLMGVRVICRDEPPVVAIGGSVAFNFIFLREPRAFLR